MGKFHFMIFLWCVSIASMNSYNNFLPGLQGIRQWKIDAGRVAG